MDTARLFIAVEIPEDIRRKLAQGFAKLPLPFDEFKRVTQDNLHITLKFLGPRPIDSIPDIIQTLQDATAALHAPEISINSGTGIPAHKPKAVGATIENPEKLIDLFTEVEESLAAAGIAQRETRIFKPHITLARIKKSMEITSEELEILNAWRIGLDFIAFDVTLIESTLLPTGPQYTVLQRFPLAYD